MNSPRRAGRRTEWAAAGAAAVTVVLWASAFVSIRSAGDAYSPGALALGRLLSGAVALGRDLRDTAGGVAAAGRLARDRGIRACCGSASTWWP